MTWKPNIDRWSLIAIAAVLLGIALVAATYRTNSQTFDEGVHVVGGLEWLERGRYTMEPHHTPLTRVAVAVGPYISGVRLTPGVDDLKVNMWEQGDSVFFAGASYTRTLTLARLGTLPFYLLFAFAVWLWSAMLIGRPGAALATSFVALSPPVIGHAALATTDVGLSATVLLAVYALIRWLDEPTTGRAAILGAAGAFAVTAKFSAIPYLGLMLLCFGGWRLWTVRTSQAAETLRPGARQWREWRTPAMRQVLAAGAAGAFVIWAVYRFSIIDLHGVPVPAGELLRGIKDASRHSVEGHYSYLLGERSMLGWWYYFPIVFAVKTPLVLLVLGAVGSTESIRRRRSDWHLATPLLTVLAVLVTGVITHINIGVRHILPLYGAWAILAALGVATLWQAGRGATMRRVVVGIGLLWFTIDVVRETPHHLAYFNEASRSDPAALLVDSNLDWGQDMLRLADELARRDISSVSVALLARPVLGKLTPTQVRYLRPGERATGWVAASETCLRNVYPELCGQLDWLSTRRPVARVGRSIQLYNVDSDGAAPPANKF